MQNFTHALLANELLAAFGQELKASLSSLPRSKDRGATEKGNEL